jgi:tetratricopeptide (TPR) repeat protein
MKTERRHELQTNVLADWLGDVVSDIQPYWKVILAVVVAALAAVFTLIYLSIRQSEHEGAAWATFVETIGSAKRGEEIERVAEKHPGTRAALWATLSASDVYLQEGQEQLFIDRDKAFEQIDKAIAGYRKVSEQGKDTLMRSRALLGLGSAYEARDNLDRAVEAYDQIVKTWPDSVAGKAAKKRLDDLNKKSTVGFYAWFFNAKPKPRSAAPPPTPQRQPQVYDDLYDDPMLSLPDPSDLTRKPEFDLDALLGPHLGPAAAGRDVPDPTRPDSASPETATPQTPEKKGDADAGAGDSEKSSGAGQQATPPGAANESAPPGTP